MYRLNCSKYNLEKPAIDREKLGSNLSILGALHPDRNKKKGADFQLFGLEGVCVTPIKRSEGVY